MNILVCDKCSKTYYFDNTTCIDLICNNCQHHDVYYYINCHYYSFFISKSKLKLYNLDKNILDKKIEYKIKLNKINKINKMNEINKIKNNLNCFSIIKIINYFF
jgi:hypothetical protein